MTYEEKIALARKLHKELYAGRKDFEEFRAFSEYARTECKSVGINYDLIQMTDDVFELILTSDTGKKYLGEN